MTSDSTLPRLVLASASPARRGILSAAGVPAEVVVSGVDESSVHNRRPDQLCLALARLKAEAVARRLDHDQRPPARTIVLGCDSLLEFDGRALGKPADAAEATARWLELSGHHGVLHTGHCIVEVGSGRSAAAVASTTVHFAEVTKPEISAYVATGEPLHVAGAFTIDGRGGVFVDRIDGDAGTVIGLSLPVLRHLLPNLDVNITDFWDAGSPDH